MFSTMFTSFNSYNKNFFSTEFKYGKSYQFNFPSSNSRVKAPLKLIHTDVWGPTPIMSQKRFKYYVRFLDNYSMFTWLYPLETKA